MSATLQKYVGAFERGVDVGGEDAEMLLDAMIVERDEEILADLFTAWRGKGIAADEIFSIASVMRRRCKTVNSEHRPLVDIVGTGGSRSKTFNVSTAAAFVLAAAGLRVAKHNNKSATSNSGSADVLEELGVAVAADGESAERNIDIHGLCFMFAPGFHKLSPTLASVRKKLGFPTVFNCVGPLCNPAGAEHQVIGVWSVDLVPKMASVLSRLGTRKSWIVHGLEGLDEISLSGPTSVAEVAGGAIRQFEIEPRSFGLDSQSSDQCRAADPTESAELIRRVFDPQNPSSPARQLVEINAAAMIKLAGNAETLEAGTIIARDVIGSGAALRKLEEMSGR